MATSEPQTFFDQLSSDAKQNITRSSTERLRNKLIKIGHEADEITQIDRPDVIELYAKEIIDGKIEIKEPQSLSLELELKQRELDIRESELKLKLEEVRRADEDRDLLYKEKTRYAESSLNNKMNI